MKELEIGLQITSRTLTRVDVSPPLVSAAALYQSPIIRDVFV